MMGTWRGDPDDAAARFLAEHGMVGRMDGDDLVIEAGNAGLLPPWPPDIKSIAEDLRSPASKPSAPNILCAVCATPVVLRGDAGWRHEQGYRETGCSTPWPSPV